MTSQLLSRIFNQNTSASIYETLREQDAANDADSDADDLEERAGLRPIAAQLDNGDEDVSDMDDSTYQLQEQPPRTGRQQFFPALSGGRGNRYAPSRYIDEDDNTEVPQSLLFETEASQSHQRRKDFDGEKLVPGPSANSSGDSGPSTMRNRRLEEQWNAATAAANYEPRGTAKRPMPQRWSVGAKERAMWKWANVENLDNFLQDVGLLEVHNEGIAN